MLLYKSSYEHYLQGVLKGTPEFINGITQNQGLIEGWNKWYASIIMSYAVVSKNSFMP